MRYSLQFRSQAYEWLLFGQGRLPPPLAWRVVAWAFLVLGISLYGAAVWLWFSGSVWRAFGAAFLGYMLRRQVRIVAPQLMERLALMDLALELDSEEGDSPAL
ncbi:MAG: hypothetical protein HY704_08275 [Gemmatimonadetes bacterium]|nr:hypothetical protein [Gemmatimonadota bacterium]